MKNKYFARFFLLKRGGSRKLIEKFGFESEYELENFINNITKIKEIIQKYNKYENRYCNIDLKWGTYTEVWDHCIFELGA